AQFIEAFAVPLPAGAVRRGDTRLEELSGCERQLIAEVRLALLPWAAHVEPCTLSKAAGELPIDEGRKPAINPYRGHYVSRIHRVDHRLDEASFVRPEGLITEWRQIGVDSARGSGHRLGGGRLGRLRESCGRRGGA